MKRVIYLEKNELAFEAHAITRRRISGGDDFVRITVNSVTLVLKTITQQILVEIFRRWT